MVFDWAAQQVHREVRDSTWQAFWLTAVEQVSAAEAAQRLGISTGSVYVAQNRVIRRLHTLIEQFDGTS